MPMQQSCGAGCDGQLRYGGSSRPSNILSPGLGCDSSRMHHMRSGGAAAGGESSRSARCAFNGGCGAFSASMAQLASSAQCSSRPRPSHSVGGGSTSGSHRLWCSSGTLHCNSPFHGPYSGSGVLAAAGGFSRGFSSQPYGSFCGFPGGVGGGAAAGGFYCGSTSSILTSAGGNRRGSCCSNVLPPQSHSHQIAKQLEQQQLEMEEAAAGAGGSHLSQGHYQYHDYSKHGGSESSYSHLLPEKLHDLVEVIRHPRSHGTQGTRIAVSSLHIGECPGVPENASSFAMKRTGTLKWQPRSALEEDEDTGSVRGSISDNCCSRGSNSHTSSGNGHSNTGTNSKNTNRSSSKSSNTRINSGSTGGTSLGLPRKVHYYLSSHDPKIETAPVAACVASPTGSTAEGGKIGPAGSGGSGVVCTTAVTAGQAVEPTQSPAAFAAESEKIRGSTCRRDAALSGPPAAAAAVGLSTATKAATSVEGSAEETCGGDARKAGRAQAERNNIDKKGEQMKRKKILGFTRRSSNVNVRKASGSARLQRYQQNRNVKEDRWAAAGATCCTADDGDGATTATGCGNSSGGSGGESDNSGPNHIIVTSSCNSTPSSLSGKESDCCGSPRRRLIEPTAEDASHANACTPAAGSGGSEMMKNFSWHKVRQKLKL